MRRRVLTIIGRRKENHMFPVTGATGTLGSEVVGSVPAGVEVVRGDLAGALVAA
jgi:hypothetical protein